MNIRNSVAKWILGKYSFLGRDNGKSYLSDFSESYQNFADVIFMNTVELLTDITNDVTIVLKSGNQMLFSEFNVFFKLYGQQCLNRLFEKGFAVIVYDKASFTLLDHDDYTTTTNNKLIITNQKYFDSEIYVLKSDYYRETGKSDRQFLNSFLTYLDNVLNASNTTTARLGSLIMASPKQSSNSPIMATITDTEKEEAEKEISEDYGGLKKQKQILIWKQAMDFVTVNLSGLDRQTIEKSKFAISVIADRLKIPANQISVIESSTSGNALSNGGEMREGDMLKYKAFERLLNKTFVRMASDLDLVIDYSIYNKPVAAQPAAPQF